MVEFITTKTGYEVKFNGHVYGPFLSYRHGRSTDSREKARAMDYFNRCKAGDESKAYKEEAS